MGENMQLLSAPEMEQRLLDAIAPFPFEETRLFRLLLRPNCPRPLIARYARSIYASTASFCPVLAALAEAAPNDRARLVLLENLLEEEGMSMDGTRGMVVRPESKHLALVVRFVRACGADVDDPGGALNVMSPARTCLEEGRWLEAVAFLLVGQELRFSTVSGQLYQAFRDHGFSAHELEFFALHGEADLKHGRQALDLVIDNATTRASQEAAIDAAEAGARRWYDLHNGAASRTVTHAA